MLTAAADRAQRPSCAHCPRTVRAQYGTGLDTCGPGRIGQWLRRRSRPGRDACRSCCVESRCLPVRHCEGKSSTQRLARSSRSVSCRDRIENGVWIHQGRRTADACGRRPMKPRLARTCSSALSKSRAGKWPSNIWPRANTGGTAASSCVARPSGLPPSNIFSLPIHAACVAAFGNGSHQDGFTQLDIAAFEACPDDSIDYAVMERIARAPGFSGVVIPLAAGCPTWGHGTPCGNCRRRTKDGNVARGRVLFEGSTDSFAHSDGRLVACVGLSGRGRVETADAILVASKDRVQEVKAIVGRLKAAKDAEAHDHRKVQRPLGLLRLDRSWRALPGQAHRRESGCAAFVADASSSGRTLDCRVRHGPCHARRRDVLAEREPVHLHPARHDASAGKSRQDAARSDRGAVGYVFGRRRYRAFR